MTPTKHNRSIHVAGLVICLCAIYLTADGNGLKSVVALAIAGIGLVGNVYGVLRPHTLLPRHHGTEE
jgi:hypothetical protein